MLTLNKPENPNYAASIVKIERLVELDNCDNVIGAIIYGNHVIVDKSVKNGDVGVFFPVECELSHDFLMSNNLYRKKELNTNPEKTGYFEENRRIKALKFRGHKSEGVFFPLSYFNYLVGEDGVRELTENTMIGTDFDAINKNVICKKYIKLKRESQPGSGGSGKKNKKVSKIIDKQFRFHDDTSQLGKNLHRFNPETNIAITYKIHGTSGISSKILCKKRLTWYEKVLKFIGVNVVDYEYDYIYSSRKVIKNDELLPTKTFDEHFSAMTISSKKRHIEKYYKDTFDVELPEDKYREIFPLDNNDMSIFTLDYFEEKLPGTKKFFVGILSRKSKGYYGEDIWGVAHKLLIPILKNGMTIYYEIAGFLENGTPIQKMKKFVFDYGIDENKFKIFVYRITYTNLTGDVFEYSHNQIKEFCKINGIDMVPELYFGKAKDFSDERLKRENWEELFLDTIKNKYNEKDCYLCKNKVPEEGCVVRIDDSLGFEAYKQKSFRFLTAESESLSDNNSIDIESEN